MSQRRVINQRNNQDTTSLTQQVFEYVSYPFTACIPSSSSSSSSRQTNDEEQRQSLLTDTTYEDSDAISLLSNIADRSRRRNRASRRRERWNKSAAVLGCGLFGRPKGQIQARQQTTGDNNEPIQRHSRSASVDSTTSTDDESGRANSFAAAQESGDEDAGMIADEAIAELSVSRDEEGDRQQTEEAEADKKKEEEEEAAAAAAAKRKEDLQRQAEESARIEAETAAKQKAEEEALAAEEEAAIAKAKRRAERKAIKQGLLEAKSHGERNTRRMTEAEAEAAAGGFDFAEEPQIDHLQEADYDEQRYHANQEEYGIAHGQEDYGYDEFEQQNQPEVVHHHHYYHEPEQEESQQPYTLSQPPITYVTEHDDDNKPEEAIDEDEEDADIAGLAFSKNRKKRLDRGGSYGSRSNGSGSGSRQSGSQPGRYDRAGGSNGSAGRRESHDAGSSNGGGSSGGKFTYRDRPRRHERTGSRSAGSGNGRALREGPGGKVITSPTILESDQSNDLSSTTINQPDDRADAAAGGFDDFLSPPPSSSINTTYTSDWRQDSNDQPIHVGGGGQKASFSPNSSTSGKAGRSRELPRKQFSGTQSGIGSLNAPRNPAVGNIFGQRQENDDEDAHLEGL